MSDLHDDPAAVGMDGIGHHAPSRNLGRCVDPRSMRIALRLRVDRRSFRDNESGRGTLRIVLSVQSRGNIAGARAHAVAEALRRAPSAKGELFVINLSGRGDKDTDIYRENLKELDPDQNQQAL